jgi:hypothetical protein
VEIVDDMDEQFRGHGVEVTCFIPRICRASMMILSRV